MQGKPKSVHKPGLIVLFVAVLLPAGAFASSDDAWEEMRADVEAKCIEAAAEHIETPAAIVDPFGSERFGLALVGGKPKGAEGKVAHICVYDKQEKTVELCSELFAGTLEALAE